MELLTQLLAETDKMNVGKIYIAVVEELKTLTFADASIANANTLYKHLVQLSIKDFIHAGRSEASANVVRDVIEMIAQADVMA